MSISINLLLKVTEYARTTACDAKKSSLEHLVALLWDKCFKRLLKHSREMALEEMQIVAGWARPGSWLDRKAAEKWPRFWDHLLHERKAGALVTGNDFIAAMPAITPWLGKLHLKIIGSVLKFVEDVALEELLEIRHGKQNGLRLALTTAGLAYAYAPPGSMQRKRAYAVWDKCSDSFAGKYPEVVVDAANAVGWICDEQDLLGQLVRRKEGAAMTLVRQAWQEAPAQPKKPAARPKKPKKKTGRTRLEIMEEEEILRENVA